MFGFGIEGEGLKSQDAGFSGFRSEGLRLRALRLSQIV